MAHGSSTEPVGRAYHPVDCRNRQDLTTPVVSEATSSLHPGSAPRPEPVDLSSWPVPCRAEGVGTSNSAKGVPGSRFELLVRIGSGGMATVHLGRRRDGGL